MFDLKIVDIHAHIYPEVSGITHGLPMRGTKLGRVKIGNQEKQFLPPSFERVYSTYDMLVAYMDWCGVDKAILMANPYYGYHNDYFIEAVMKHPDRLKGVAIVDINKGKEAADELSHLYEDTSLIGFKIETDSTFQCAPGRRMTDPQCEPVWQCINAYRQPTFIHPFTKEDLEDIQELAATYAQITFVVCHMGADACFASQASKTAYDYLLETAKKYPNVYLDTSTVPIYFLNAPDGGGYPFQTAQAVIEKGYKELGPEKLMWSSDYPGMLNHATYKQLITFLIEGCPNIPIKHKEMIMGGNAIRMFF